MRTKNKILCFAHSRYLCCCSVAKLCPTLQPQGLQHARFLSSTISPNLLKFMSIDLVMIPSPCIFRPHEKILSSFSCSTKICLPFNTKILSIHGLLHGVVVVGALVAKLCPIHCDPMDWSPPGSSVHGIS